MKGSAGRIGLALAMICLLCLVRPASAQTADQFNASRQLILSAVNTGQIKCVSRAEFLVQFLNLAQASSGTNRSRFLTFARDCACALSREIQFSTDRPFTTLTGLQDLALGLHTAASQTAAREICDSIQGLLTIAGPLSADDSSADDEE
jgi:hypothetical protein